MLIAVVEKSATMGSSPVGIANATGFVEKRPSIPPTGAVRDAVGLRPKLREHPLLGDREEQDAKGGQPTYVSCAHHGNAVLGGLLKRDTCSASQCQLPKAAVAFDDRRSPAVAHHVRLRSRIH